MGRKVDRGGQTVISEGTQEIIPARKKRFSLSSGRDRPLRALEKDRLNYFGSWGRLLGHGVFLEMGEPGES